MTTLRSRRKLAPGTAGVEARDQLLSALNEYKDKTVALHASGGGISEEKFLSCVSKVLCEKKGKKNEVRKGGSIPRCSKILKILWLCILCLLTFGLLAAGFKPLSFRLHQILHDRLYYILRPVRLGMVTIIPYLDAVGMDFLNTDCMFENPLLSSTEKCACFNIKYCKEMFMNSSSLPSEIINFGDHDVLDVYLLRNLTQFQDNFTIDTFIKFPLSNEGIHPLVCHQVIGENLGIHVYDELFNEDMLSNALNNGNAWSFSWEECPDDSNSLTLQSLIPPLRPVLHNIISPVSTFTIGSKWSMSTNFMESFPTGALVIVRMLFGEARYVMEPQRDECFDICSGFKLNPVLKQGDALVFDQRVWTFKSTSWSNLTFYTIQLISSV